jgi:hypothetical protein
VGGGLELYGARAVQRGVSTAAVVEPLGVLEDRVRELDAGAPALPVEQLGLHARPERLGDGIVVRIANGSQGREQARSAGAFGEGPGRD